MRVICLIVMALSAHLYCASQTYQEWVDKALTYLEKDSVRQAINCYQHAVDQTSSDPHKVLLYTNIGSLYRQIEQLDSAIDAYSQALLIEPNRTPVLLSRAAVYMMQNIQNKAYADYCRVLELNHDQTEALAMRAYIYQNRHDYGAARVDYLRLLQIDPQHYVGRLGLIELDRKENRPQSALSQLNLFIAERPTDAVLYLTRAGVEADLHQWELALVDLNEALRLNPQSVEALLARGEAYLQLKKKVLARQDFEKAISLGVPVLQLKEQLRRCK